MNTVMPCARVRSGRNLQLLNEAALHLIPGRVVAVLRGTRERRAFGSTVYPRIQAFEERGTEKLAAVKF